MLTQQAAEATAKAEHQAEEAADAGESAAARSCETSSSAVVAAAAAEDSTESPAARTGAARGRVDKSPLRDQDECTPLPSSHFMRADSSSHLGCEFSSSVEARPRATPRSGRRLSTTGHLPPRQSRSSHQHMERLQSARQSGVCRPSSSSSGAPAAAGSNGGLSHRQPLAAAGSCSSLKEQASRLTCAASSSSGARVPAASSARGDAGVPMTSRISGFVNSRVTELSSSTMSMRQPPAEADLAGSALWHMAHLGAGVLGA
ncbi:hypothetical protein COO60DRAFT_1697481 [Scenedesmus sp. NREL 46B-D3]|nr:hypothetical protein COO60DRAFT_1697481 [Scenedesmus sp. NREL 46B-D3]